MPRILIVEDNELSRDMLSRRLERRGYSVIAAPNGELGYTLADLEMPDLILMDISLPGMDGWQVIELLKAKEATRHIPVFVLTAHALVTDRSKAFEAGCEDYFPKPIDFEKLIAAIGRLLLEKRPA